MTVTLEVTGPTYVDRAFRIVARRLEPHRRMTLELSATDSQRRLWRSSAEFVPDDEGCVDTTRDAPITGTYEGVDPLGLLWSLSPVDHSGSTPAQWWFDVKVAASVEHELLAEASTARVLRSQDVSVEAVNEAGIRGEYVRLRGRPTYPGVLVIGGTPGIGGHAWTSLLASRGYAALSVAYFGVGELPRRMKDVPLEYFGRAIAWLLSRNEVRPKRLAVMGISGGGAAALLAAAQSNDVSAVVGLSSAVVLPRALLRRSAPWTRRGKPVATFSRPRQLRALMRAARAGRGHSQAGLVDALVEEFGAAKCAPFVDLISGPILLLCGDRDELVPVSFGSCVLSQRGARSHHDDAHVVYEGAGHGLAVPGTPSAPSAYTARSLLGERDAGGSPRANAVAGIDAWRRMLRLLSTHVGPPLD